MSSQNTTVSDLDPRPGYWIYETSGVLRPAMEAYLDGRIMTAEQVAAMRAYLRQWIAAPAWRGAIVQTLREQVDGLTTRRQISAWLDKAIEAGVDPL